MGEKSLRSKKKKKNSYIQRHHYDHYHYHLTKSDTKELFARYSRLAQQDASFVRPWSRLLFMLSNHAY